MADDQRIEGLTAWEQRAQEVRNDVQDFWPPWFEVAEADEWIVTFALPLYTPTRNPIKRAIAGFDTKDGAESLAAELNTFVQCAIDEATLAAITTERQKVLDEVDGALRHLIDGAHGEVTFFHGAEGTIGALNRTGKLMRYVRRIAEFATEDQTNGGNEDG